MRSRVMPGSSPTMERREPVRRLKSVDLPTLGRPQMAMSGRRRLEAAGFEVRSSWRESCSASRQARISARGSGSGRPMLAELGVRRPAMLSAGRRGLLASSDGEAVGGGQVWDGTLGRWCGGIPSRGSGWGCASSFRARRSWWRALCACADRPRRWWARRAGRGPFWGGWMPGDASCRGVFCRRVAPCVEPSRDAQRLRPL